MTREDLYTHYRAFYGPNNAILAAAGDFNAGEMLRMIESTFGKIAARNTLPQVTAQEPLQRGERRVSVEGDAGTDYLTMAFHTPEATHPDIHALTVLSTVLAGGSGSLVGRGSLTNYTSRLYRAVVQSQIAADVSASLIPTVDPNLYRISATVLPEHSPAEVENAIRAAISEICNNPITAEELAKAKRQARALFAFSSESITNQAFWLGFSEIFADTSWFLRYLERLETVTAEDVLRVANTYLRPQNLTVGHYLSSHSEQ
jgi:zinc protease